MSKEKYLSIFLKSNGGYYVYYPSNIFRNMRESSGSAIVICQSRQSLSVGFQNLHVRLISLQSKALVWGKGKTVQRKINLFNSVPRQKQDTSADKVTGNLTTS